MSLLGVLQAGNNTGSIPRWQDQFKSSNQRDFKVQVIISAAFGLSAFLSFCVCGVEFGEGMR